VANLAVQRSVARYHLRPSQAAQRGRLDSIFGTLFEDSPDLLAAVRTSAEEEICISNLQVVVPVRLDASDAALTRAWVHAIEREIDRTISKVGISSMASTAVRYRSRGSALLDLVKSVAAEDMQRAWAWAQLGLIRPGAATTGGARLMLEALTREPHHIVPVLSELARSHRFARVAETLRGPDWWTLASAALAATRIPVIPAHLLSLSPRPEGRQRARAIASASNIWRARPRIRDQAFIEERGAVALAILATLEAEPALLLFDPVRALDAVAALAEASVRDFKAEPASEPAQSREPHRSDAPILPVAAEHPPGHAAAIDAVAAESSVSDVQPVAASEDAHEPAANRTEWGGLLFLLHLVDRIGMPESVTSDEVLGDRPLRWVLHQLAQTIAPVSPTDPAALAFAGLAPSSEPPESEPAQPEPRESAAIHALRGRLAEELRDLLERRDDDEEALLAEVTRRGARIDADPGWLVVHLPLSSVSTEVRRAGLDLDLGYVPWLGVVIRFAYE
jgi:hypothetical protein